MRYVTNKDINYNEFTHTTLIKKGACVQMSHRAFTNFKISSFEGITEEQSDKAYKGYYRVNECDIEFIN